MQQFNSEGPRPAGDFLKNLHPFAYVAIVLSIIFLLYQVIGALIILAAGGGTDLSSYDIQISRIVLAFGQYMFILAPVIFFARLQTPDLKEMFRLRMPKPSLLFLAILGIILVQPFLQGYLYFQEQAINNIPLLRDTLKPVKELWDQLEGSVIKIVTAYSSAEFAVVVFVVCVTPAICEEFLFRGFVLSNLNKAAKAGTAISISGILFAAYHFQPFSLLPLVVLGFFLGFVVYYSKSIFTGIACHFLNNFFASYYLYAYGKPEFDNPKLVGSEEINTLIAGLISGALFVLVVYIYYKMRVREEAA